MHSRLDIHSHHDLKADTSEYNNQLQAKLWPKCFLKHRNHSWLLTLWKTWRQTILRRRNRRIQCQRDYLFHPSDQKRHRHGHWRPRVPRPTLPAPPHLPRTVPSMSRRRTCSHPEKSLTLRGKSRTTVASLHPIAYLHPHKVNISHIIL